MQCPACKTGILRHRRDFPFGDFDGSIFNFTARILECEGCGLVRINSEFSDETVSRHYAQDCLYALMTGVGVGGDSPEDLVRYDYYIRLLAEYGLVNGSLADIGCSRGGFLKRLRSAVPAATNLLGVDIDAASLQGLAAGDIESRVGDAFSLPLPPASRETLCYFHVLEHIYDFEAVMGETARVLAPGGTAIFEVPDAVAYQDARVGTLFWAAMKEHVNHFTVPALEAALARQRLAVVGVHRAFLPMKGGHSYPSLIIAVRRTGQDPPVRLPGPDAGRIMAYFQREDMKFKAVADDLKNFLAKHLNVTFWGISLEFFNLAAHGLLKYGRSVNLVDANPGKHGRTVQGYAVKMPPAARPGDGLVCCSYLSRSSLLAGARDLGWTDDHIFVLS